MKLSDYNWDLLPVHTIIKVKFTIFEREMEMMWRGYGRFTNLTTGSEWFVDESNATINRVEIPAFTIGG